MATGWGAMPWGGGPWGGAAFGLSELYAVGERMIRVKFTSSPQLDAAPGGIYCAQDWIVTRVDTGAVLSVMCVQYVVLPTVFDIVTFEVLPSFNVEVTVANSRLKSSAGMQIGASGTTRGTSWTDAVREDDGAFDRRLVPRDLANRATPGPTWRGGTLQIDPGGDYGTMSGVELWNKLIRRRIMTPKGAFRHLPDYGFGFVEKGVFRTAELPSLRNDILKQVKSESEVDDASVALTMDGAHGILTLDLKVKLRRTGVLVGITGMVIGRIE